MYCLILKESKSYVETNKEQSLEKIVKERVLKLRKIA